MKKSFLFKIMLFIAVVYGNQVMAQWQQTNFPSGYVNSMLAFNGVVVASINEDFYISSDQGDSWNPGGNGIVQKPVYRLQVNPASGELYATSIDYIYKSSDNGLNWNVVSGPPAISNIYAFYLYNGYIFATTTIEDPNFGLNRSDDDGATWEHITNGLTSNGIRCFTNDNSYLFAGLVGTGPGSQPGVFRSDDNGSSWVFASNGFLNDINSLSIFDNKVWAVSYSNIYYSADQGGSWNPTTGLFTGIPVIEIEPCGDFLLACQIYGVYRLPATGTTWSPWFETLIGTSMQAVTSDELFVYAGTSDNGIWRRPVNQLVGLNEKANTGSDKWISISPNPVDATSMIRVISTFEDKLEFRVYDSEGRIAGIKNYTLNSGQNHFPLKLTWLKPGIYYYKAILGNHAYSGKLTILNQ